MSSLMHKPTGPTLEGQTANLRRQATATPAFRPEFRRSLRMHPAVAASVAAIVLLVLVAFALQQKPMFYAETLIYIEPFNSKVLADGTGGGFDSTKYDSSVAQQMLTAQRSDIIIGALNTLPRQVWSVYGATPQLAAVNLQGQLKVARVTTSYQVAIGLKGPDASNTAAIVNAITTAYLEAGRKDEISQADQRSQLLSEERGRIEQELAQTRAEQTRLGSQLGIANPGVNNANPYDSQLDALRQQLVQARAGHDQAAAQLAAISGVNAGHASGLTAAANEIISADPGLGSMKSTINQRRAQLSSQMAGLTPGNPIYKQDQDELTDLDKTLDSMTVQLRDRAARQLQDKLRTDLERSSDVEGRLNGELARQTSSATTASPRLQRAAELNADVQRLTTRYATVDNALHSLQLETSGPGQAHLALAAAVPTGPEPSKRRLILLAALPLALLSGLGAAVFKRKRDRHIYTGADVDDALGFAPIAILPARAEVSAQVLDEYALRLAAGVEGAYRSGNARTFLITPVSNETDITPLLQALDQKLVELGLGVVVLEAATVFEQQQAAPASAIAGYEPARNYDNPDRHYEGLADSLFSRMRAEHDVILLHAPALLISAQAEYVARCSDVTLLVAESAVTTRGELFQAGHLLQRLNVTGVGSVLVEVQLRYADGVFARGVQALEGRSRPVRQQRKAATVDPAPKPASFSAPVAEAFPAYVPATHAEAPPAISVEPAEAPWYPDHVVAAAETPAPAAPHDEPVLQSDPVPHPIEAEHPAPMAFFDSNQPAPSRRQSNSLPDASHAEPIAEPEDETSQSNWFKRLFKREPEPAVSFLPDNNGDEEEQETPAAPVKAYDASRYDLPLPVEYDPAPVEYFPDLIAEAEPIEEAQAPVFLPVADIVETPLPQPPSIEPMEIAAAPPAEDPQPALAPAPDVPLDVPLDAYAFAPEAVALKNPDPAVPVRTTPTRPLSFHELSRIHEQEAPAPAEPLEVADAHALPTSPSFQHFEAPEPEPVPYVESPIELAQLVEPEQLFEAPTEPVEDVAEAQQPEPVYTPVPEPAPAPVATNDEWNPAPLNRWDPIPPLRQQEPWRISSGSIRAARQQPEHDVWRGEDPVHVPPVDRWVSADSLPPDAPPAESNDVVLTRRWGLLSRFQQGESFQSTHRPQAPRKEEKNDEYAQDFGHDYDPEYDRPRR